VTGKQPKRGGTGLCPQCGVGQGEHVKPKAQTGVGFRGGEKRRGNRRTHPASRTPGLAQSAQEGDAVAGSRQQGIEKRHRRSKGYQKSIVQRELQGKRKSTSTRRNAKKIGERPRSGVGGGERHRTVQHVNGWRAGATVTKRLKRGPEEAQKKLSGEVKKEIATRGPTIVTGGSASLRRKRKWYPRTDRTGG